MGNSNRQENFQSYIYLNHCSFQKHSIDFLEKIIPEKSFSFLTEKLCTEIIQKPWEEKSPPRLPKTLVAEQISSSILCRVLSWTFSWVHASSDYCQQSGGLVASVRSTFSGGQSEHLVPRGTHKGTVQSGILRWFYAKGQNGSFMGRQIS